MRQGNRRRRRTDTAASCTPSPPAHERCRGWPWLPELNIREYGSRDTERRATPQRHRIGVAERPECAPQAGQHQFRAQADGDSESTRPTEEL